MADSDIRVQRSIRIPVAVDALLVVKAAERGLSINDAVLTGIESWIGVAAAFGEEPPASVPVESAGVASCGHPKGARQVFGWGSRCGDCGARL